MIFSKKIFITLIAIVTCLSFTVNAFANVKLVKNKDGVWKLLVNHKPYFVKGIAYSCDRVGSSTTNTNEWMWADVNNNGIIDDGDTIRIDSRYRHRDPCDLPAAHRLDPQPCQMIPAPRGFEKTCSGRRPVRRPAVLRRRPL